MRPPSPPFQTDNVDRDEQLYELLERMIVQTRDGQSPDVELVCREHPALADELRELWSTAMVAEDLASHFSDGSDAVSAELADSDVSLPRTMGDYELIEELGRGGMGVVYRAHQRSLDRTVAVKMLLRVDLATEADLERFRREAGVVARLEHPQIVKVFEVGEFHRQPFFSMQYVEGETLSQRIQRGPLSAHEAARLLIPVCRAIGHAHRQGVLHRDLKPSNVLIDRSEQTYVTDFGLAKQVTSIASHRQSDEEKTSTRRPEESQAKKHPLLESLTLSGAILGTPGYMAPEQAIGFRGELTPATDVYALGAILYAMLSGRAPFDAASPMDVVLMVLEQDPISPRLLNPQANADLELIALKALQKPADLRYQSTDALADDLEAFLNGEPLAARSSHFSQVISRAFRPTHHIGILHDWGLLWMWHALALLVLCLVTNGMQWRGVDARVPYLLLWTLGLGTWAGIFWNLRRRSGPVTFVERQIAHVWAASMACSVLLYGVESLLRLPVLSLSPILALFAGAVFVVKAGILSGEFYVHAVVLFATAVPMALFPDWGLTIFGVVSGLAFFLPGWKFHRQRLRNESTTG